MAIVNLSMVVDYDLYPQKWYPSHYDEVKTTGAGIWGGFWVSILSVTCLPSYLGFVSTAQCALIDAIAVVPIALYYLVILNRLEIQTRSELLGLDSTGQ